jgi:hypothetical protein
MIIPGVVRSLAVLLFLSTLSAAQEPIRPPLSPRIITATKLVDQFADMERQLLRSIEKKDKPALTALISDDLSIAMPDSDLLPGEDWTESVLSKDFQLKSWIVRQLTVADLGDSMLVSFDRVQQATFKGKADSGEFFVTDIWKKDGDNWKLTNRFVAKVSSEPWMPKGPVRPTGKQ